MVYYYHSTEVSHSCGQVLDILPEIFPHPSASIQEEIDDITDSHEPDLGLYPKGR
jgi:hypothetical protein